MHQRGIADGIARRLDRRAVVAEPGVLEETVAKPLEAALSTTENLTLLETQVQEGNVGVEMHFSYGTDIDDHVVRTDVQVCGEGAQHCGEAGARCDRSSQFETVVRYGVSTLLGADATETDVRRVTDGRHAQDGVSVITFRDVVRRLIPAG